MGNKLWQIFFFCFYLPQVDVQCDEKNNVQRCDDIKYAQCQDVVAGQQGLTRLAVNDNINSHYSLWLARPARLCSHAVSVKEGKI